MSIPKEPRQMMINMMYLVLTALLAMNVSAEILNAFHTVNRGISNSNTSVDSKTDNILNAFVKEVQADPKKAGPWKDKADQVHATTQQLVTYIEMLKDEIITASGGWKDHKGVAHPDGKGWKEELGELSNHADLDATTRIFIENTKATPRAPELRKKIEDTRKKLMEILGPEDGKEIEASLPLKIDEPLANDEGEKKSWEESNFHMVPTIATVTLLNKFENDAKNSEAQIMDHLIKKIGSTDFKADKLVAKVIAPSSYVLEGQQYKADIFVAAYNSTQDPVVYVGSLNGAAHKDKDGNYDVVGTNPVSGAPIKAEGGMGRYETNASGDAEHTLSGAVMVKVAGVEKYYPFETKWQSAKAAVVISPTKMNVFYIGVPNPVDISIPGIPSDKIQPAITQGSISADPQKKGSYIVTVATQGTADINVSAKLADNNVKPMGKMTFRVKRIPDPNAKVGNLIPGGTSSTLFKAQGFVLAPLDNFDFDARFTVLSYSMTYAAKRQDLLSDVQTSGSKLTDRMASWVSKAKPGDIFYIDDIKVKGPDNSVRKLAGIAYKIVN